MIGKIVMMSELKKPLRLYLFSIAVIISIWAFYITKNNAIGLFEENWFMSVTMLFASFIAGATSEGGGAVAFPVMTLLFNITPEIARDFSLMIQSFGMIMASYSIFIFRIKVLPKVIVTTSLGGILGITLGFHLLNGLLPPAYVKMFFTSFWLSFGISLYFTTKNSDLLINEDISEFNLKKLFLFFGIGVCGGAISSLTGTGIDIVTFSILTLVYRVCVKIATPTTVVLMGINSVVGFIYKENFMGGMASQSWDYLLVCIPIVIIGAPFGAIFISNKSKKLVQNILFVSILVQFVSSLIIIPQDTELLMFSGFIFTVGLTLFLTMALKNNFFRKG